MTFGTQFLTYPELFPARLAGESWGSQSLYLRLAGADYALTGLSEIQQAAISVRFGALCRATATDVAAELHLYQAEAEDFLGIPYPGWAYSLDCDYQPQHLRLAGLGLMARLELAPTWRGGLWVPTADAQMVADGTLENILRVLVAYRLLAQGGLLLHSAGTVRDGAAYIFFGHSGAGKSTISRLNLSAGLTVLSDDMNALVWRAGQWWVEKLPFAGDLGQNAVDAGCYPLHGLYRLVKAPHHALHPLLPARATASLLACAPYVNQNPHLLDSLLIEANRIVTGVTVAQLEFALDSGFWRCLVE